jgi:hypothetical protein
MAAKVAEVLAGPKPRFVAHDLDDNPFVVRQRDQAVRPRARLLDDGHRRALHLLGRHEDRVLPLPVTLAERPVAGKQLRDYLVGRCEDGFVRAARPDAIAALDLVGIRRALARQHAGVRAQAEHLVAQPAVLQLVDQQICGGDERPRVDRRLRVDCGRQLGPGRSRRRRFLRRAGRAATPAGGSAARPTRPRNAHPTAFPVQRP